MKKFDDFFEAWWYLNTHGAFIDKKLKYDTENRGSKIPVIWSAFEQLLDIYVTKVNPDTNEVDDDKRKNIMTEIWLELSHYEEDKDFPGNFLATLDTRLCCGGKTFEEAIINLANLVKKYYPLSKYGKLED